MIIEPMIEETSSSICKNAKLNVLASPLIRLIISPLLVFSYAKEGKSNAFTYAPNPSFLVNLLSTSCNLQFAFK